MAIRVHLLRSLALILCFSFLFSSIPLSATAQAGPPEMRVEGNVMLSGLASLQGSGTMTVTYTGEAAVTLRTYVFDRYDASADQTLNRNEPAEFLQSVSNNLVGKMYWGVTIKSATNFTGQSVQFIESHSKGLVNSPYNDTQPIAVTIGFDGSGASRTKTIETAQETYDAFAIAIQGATRLPQSHPDGYQFSGTMTISVRVTSFAIGSFTSPTLNSSSITSIRNPLGNIMWYSFSGSVGPSVRVDDSLAYEGFAWFENQQIAFVVLIVGAIIILRMPGSKFDKFEKLHPRKFRKYAKPLLSVKISSILVVLALVTLYLLPFAFSFISKEAMFYAAYLYILVPLALVGEHLFSKSMYDKAALSIPDESVIEVKQAAVVPEEGEGEILCKICYRPIEAGLEMLQCGCGLTMHTDCAEKAQNCPSCGEPLFQQRTRSIECRACGETFMYSGEEDPYSIQCTKCGAFQEEIKPGRNYLIAAEEPRNAYMMVRSMFLSQRPAMILTTEFPGKIRSDYDLRDIQIKRFSETPTDIDDINPRDLEGDSMEIASTFLMTTKAAGVLIDGFPQLVEMNGYDKVLAFIKRLNDLASIHGSTIVVSVDKTKLPEDQYKRLSDEFGEVHDYQ